MLNNAVPPTIRVAAEHVPFERSCIIGSDSRKKQESQTEAEALRYQEYQLAP